MTVCLWVTQRSNGMANMGRKADIRAFPACAAKSFHIVIPIIIDILVYRAGCSRVIPFVI